MPVSEERVRELLAGDEPDYVAAAAEVGLDGLPVVAPLLSSAEPLVAVRATALIATMAADPVVAVAALPILLLASTHSDRLVRAAAMLGAREIGEAALSMVQPLLSDTDAFVRRMAVRALTPPLPPDVVQQVEENAQQDEDPASRDEAAGLASRTPEPSLGNEILATVLEFVYERLTQLRTAALGAVEALAGALGQPAFVDAGGVVNGRLVAARAALDLAPPRIAAHDFTGAAVQFGLALSAVRDAIATIGGADLGSLLTTQISWDAVAPKGLAAQLGLPSVPLLRYDAGVLRYSVSAPAKTLVPAPLTLGFESAELAVRLRVDPAQSIPPLSITLTLTGVEIGVGGEPIEGLLGRGGSARSDLVVGVDTERGLTIGGSGARTVLPATAKTGTLDLREVVLELPTGTPGRIDVGATVGVSLGGVIAATVDGAGLHLRIDPAKVAAGTNPLSVSAKAPSGIGLSIDTGLVRGGGFLGERPNGYGGALDLRLGPIEVKAVGLLTLDPGFALVVVMSVGFRPPIDLTFGFTLNAVGGVLGVEHRLDSDALRAGMSSGAIDHLLFPADPVAAAPAILSTLEQVFPRRSGAMVIGPMVEIGWGRPVSFLTAQLGVIVSLPDPKVVIIGRVRIALPAPDLPVVDLHAVVYGEITPDYLLVRVSLSGSRIAAFPVDGDIGVLLRWGGSAEFALSAGGFHPRYSPPPELAGMRRLGMDLSPPAILMLRAEAYFALTSNTVQLGARVELSADIGVADISGHFGFDALVIFSPKFSFLITVGIGLTVHVMGTTLCGVRVDLDLEGPAPWRAEGSAEVEIFWTTIPIDVGPFTWGERDNPPPPFADPRRLVHESLHRNPGAWQALVPPDADRVVRLKQAPPSEVSVTVHPMGLFDVRQHAVPLETVISRVGANPVPDGQRRVHLGVPLVNETPAGALSEVTDLFSAGTYLDLTEDQKLSRPGFEPMPAGVRLRPPGEQADFARARQAELRYETFVCDDESLRGVHSRASLDVLSASAAALGLAAGAAGRSELRAATRYFAEPDPIVLADAGEVTVRSKVTLGDQAAGQWSTYTHAAESTLDSDAQLARWGVA